MSRDVTTATPTWAKVLTDAIDAKLFDLHTCMPGTIDTYDPKTGLASVVPALKRTYRTTGEVVTLPLLSRVPVLMPRAAGGAAFISLPLAKGDPVTLVFSERSLDAWKSTPLGSGPVDPVGARKHDLTDAYCFPGGYPVSGPSIEGATADDLVLGMGGLTVSLKKTGGVHIQNGTGSFDFEDNADLAWDTGTVQALFGSGGKVKLANKTAELVATLVLLMQDIQAATTATMLGPEPLVMANFASHLANLQSFQE